MKQNKKAYRGRKFALISHILPPSPSGQSILIKRLLQDMDPDAYCLINSGYPNPSNGALPGKNYRLRPILRFPVFNIPLVSHFLLIIKTLWGIIDRARQIAKIVVNEKCDLLIGCTGGLQDLPATWLASLWTRQPFIAYIMDDYVFQWMGFQRQLASWMESVFINSANKIFVLNEFVYIQYTKRYGLIPDIIHNPVHLPALEEQDCLVPASDQGCVNIVYTGAVYHAHFDAFRNLANVLNDDAQCRIKLHIYTSQPPKMIEQQGIGGPAVVFHAHIPQNEVFAVLRQADILFLPLAFQSSISEVIRTSAPFKTSEYLAIGKPILVHAPADCFLSWYFRRHHCGMVVDQNDQLLLKESLDRLLLDKKLQGTLAVAARRRAEVDFEINLINQKFVSLLNDVITYK